MAEKRMFSKMIVDSDAFLEMPLSTQALYFHLSMRADDDGFLNNAKKIMKIIGANQNDYDLLVSKAFIIQFPEGICVIKHWRINNYLRRDRYTETQYTEEKAMLNIKDNKAYTLDKSKGKPLGIPVVDQMETQIRLDKSREDKNNISKEISVEQNSTHTSECKEIIAYLNEKAGKNFKPNTRATQRLISARLNEGFTVDDFKTVIDNKVAEWKGDAKMDQYLQPSTLFAPSHFDGYLNQKAAKPSTGSYDYERLNDEMEGW